MSSAPGGYAIEEVITGFEQVTAGWREGLEALKMLLLSAIPTADLKAKTTKDIDIT